jgi:hypothetical protein
VGGSAAALAERGAQLSPDELFTELEVKTTLPVDVMIGLARTRGEENIAARAARARAAGQNLAAAVSAGQPADGPADAPDSAAAGVPAGAPVPGNSAGERVPLDRSAVRLAAENFPSTAAEGIRAARSGQLRRRPRRSPARPPPRRKLRAVTGKWAMALIAPAPCLGERGLSGLVRSVRCGSSRPRAASSLEDGPWP